MRGLVQRRCLAIAETRARGPSSSRKLSGIGRGQVDGREAGTGARHGNHSSHDDADEPLFPVGRGGYGHGAPLNSNIAGSGGSGIGPDLVDQPAFQSVAPQFGDRSMGRGSVGYKLSQTGGAIPSTAGPLLPGISLGRGSSLQRPGPEASPFPDRKPSMPAMSLGLGGFGRGKTAQTDVQSKDSFSEGPKTVLPKWNETIRRIEEKDNALRAEELKRFEDARPAPVLGYPGQPGEPVAGSGPRSIQGQGDDFPSRNTQSTRPTLGFSQRSRPLDSGRFAFQEDNSEAVKGDNLAQAPRSSTVSDWQHHAVAGGVASGQGRQPSPPLSHHVAVGDPSAYQQATPPSHFSEAGTWQYPASPQPSRPQFASTGAGRQNSGSVPGSASSMSKPYDNTEVESQYRASSQAVPAFPGLATASTNSYYSKRQVPPASPGLATARTEPHDNTKKAPETRPGLATAMPMRLYDHMDGQTSYSAGDQAVPTFLGPRTATPRFPYDSTKVEHNIGGEVSPAFPGLATASTNSYNSGRQVPPAYPGLATAKSNPYERGSETGPGLAISMPMPYDHTDGKPSYSVGKQSAPTFLGSPTAKPRPHESTKDEYYVGREPPAFPGLATARGQPYDNTMKESYFSAPAPKQSPPSFPGSSGTRQTSPVFSQSGIAEFYDDPARQAPPKPLGSTMGESNFGTSWRAAPSAPVTSEKEGSLYKASRQGAAPTFSVSRSKQFQHDMTDQQIDSAFSGMRLGNENTMGETSYGVPGKSPPAFPGFGGTRQASPPSKPLGSGMGEFYDGSTWYAAPSAPVRPETEGSLYMADRQTAPPIFSASRSEQFQHDTSDQPSEPVFSGMMPAQDFPAMPLYDESYNQEGWDQAWPTVAPPAESSQQTLTDFQQTEQWYSDMGSNTTQASWPSTDSTSQQTQGQYGHDSRGWQPSWSASASPNHAGGDIRTPEGNDYNYDWIGQSPEATAHHQVASHQSFAGQPVHPEVGSEYDERIEECYRQGRLEAVSIIYDEMKVSQAQANPKTYDTLMQTFMKLGKAEKVSQVYQEMRAVILPNYAKTHDPGVEDDTTRTVLKDKEKPASTAFTERTVQSGYAVSEEIPRSEVKLHIEDYTEQQPRQVNNKEGEFLPTNQSDRPDESSQSFLPFGMQRSSARSSAGRGTRVTALFDFAAQEGLGLGRGQPQPVLETDSRKIDDYSETFRPVIIPELQYAFAPKGLSGVSGAGAGRGRPLSPQTTDGSIGRGMPLSPLPYDTGIGGQGRLQFPQAYDAGIRGRKPLPQYMEAAVQPQQPLYAEDLRDGFQQDYAREKFQSTLSQEEAGDRAMQILDERLNRKLRRMEEWSRYDDDKDSIPVRKMPIRMPQARAPKEKRQLTKLPEQEKEAQLTEEQAKEEIARARAIEKNEQIEELQHTLSQFMKNYGQIGLELEYLMGDFMSNPDIEEKPLPPLDEYLEKAKPNIMKTGIIRSEEEWQRMVKDVMKNASYFEEFVEEYSGPGRYTAKQENEDLEAIAKTLPSEAGPKFQSSLQRCLTTLKSNPGFNLDEKQWMLSNMVDEFYLLSQYKDHSVTALS